MEKVKQIERCMKMQCDFCNRKSKCDKEIDKEGKKYEVKSQKSR